MKQPKKQAHVHYRTQFRRKALRKIFDDKIASSHAVGRDGTRQKDFKSKFENEISLILRKVDNCAYKFTTYKSKLISKGPHRLPRVISIPTIRDRLTLRALCEILMDVFEEAQIKRPHVFIKSVAEILNADQTDLVFVRMDIKDFFPSINHEILVRQVRRKIRKKQLIHLLLQAITTPTAGVKNLGKGVPQGLSISNILSSINLQEIDNKYRKKVHYFRYVDDILVICKAKNAKKIYDEIQHDLMRLGLECHEIDSGGKSEITPVKNGVDYLGFRLSPSQTSVRDSSFRRMFENLLAVFTNFKHLPKNKRNENQLIWRLNLKITGCIYNGKRYGWMLFFSQINDRSQLARLDRFVADQLSHRDLAHLKPNTKRYLKTYHEIRFNLRSTAYIPKYDEYDIDDIITELTMAQGGTEKDYRSNFSEAEIRKKFFRLVDRHTRQLELDLIEASS